MKSDNNKLKSGILKGLLILVILVITGFYLTAQEIIPTQYHTVGKKDNLWKISSEYRVPIKMLLKWNHLKDIEQIKFGDRLIIGIKGHEVNKSLIKEKAENEEKIKEEKKEITIEKKKETAKGGEKKSDKILEKKETVPVKEKNVVTKPAVNNNATKPVETNSDTSANNKYVPTQSYHGYLSPPLSDLNLKHNKKWGFLGFFKYFLFYRTFTIRLLSYIMLFFLCTLLILFVIIISKRIYQITMDKKIVFYRKKYSEAINYFLFNEYTDFKVFGVEDEMKTKYKREIIIDEILSLQRNFTGELSDKMKELYFTLGLKEYSLKKLNSRYWDVKAKGFRELGQMMVKEANDKILKYVNSKNEILRLEAELALIKLNEDDPMLIFDKMNKKLTPWGQMNIQIKVSDEMEIDTFRKLLNSKNESIVIFALRILGLKKQITTFTDVVKFLNHPNENIREAAITTIGNFEIPESVSLLIKMFDKETLHNQLNIVNLLSTHKDDENVLEFFKFIAFKDYNSIVKLLVTKILTNMGPKGIEKLDEIFDEADDDLRNIINQNRNR